MKAMMIAALCATACSLPASAAPAPTQAGQAVVSRTVLLNRNDLASVKSRPADFAGLVKSCTRQLGYRPVPAAVFGPDPHYNATGLNSSPNNGKQLAADSRAAYRAAVCHIVTGQPRYAATAQRILDAWSGTLKSVTTKQGRSGINFSMPYMIAAASWVQGANGWKSDQFDSFLRAVVLPNSESANPNNHGMWGVFMEASAAAHLGDAQLLGRARARWIEIFKGAAASDGTLIREVERSGTTNWRAGPDKGAKGIAYTHYFLLPASMAAKVFADQGRPAWDSDGGKLLEAGFAKAAGWTRRPETFPFYASNNGKLEGVRSIAYFPLLLRFYSNRDAEALLAQDDAGDGGFQLPSLFPRAGKTKS